MKQVTLSEIKTEQELVAIAAKGYTTSAATRLIEKLKEGAPEGLSPSELGTYLKRVSNLTGPKTIEGRLASLANLRAGNKKEESENPPFDPSNPMAKFLENDEERSYFAKKRSEYMKQFSIKTSADETVLNQILMEEIALFRLREQQTIYHRYIKKNPSNPQKRKDPGEAISFSVKTIRELIQTLGIDGKTRKKGSEAQGGDVATAAIRFEKHITGDRANDPETDEIDAEVEAFNAESLRKKEEELRNLGV